MIVEVLRCQFIDLPGQDIPHPISTELALDLFPGEVAGKDMNAMNADVSECEIGIEGLHCAPPFLAFTFAPGSQARSKRPSWNALLSSANISENMLMASVVCRRLSSVSAHKAKSCIILAMAS
jgi:hypothetical protein